MPNQDDFPTEETQDQRAQGRGYYYREAHGDYEFEIGFATHGELMDYLREFRAEVATT
jgi:hypothetical protein